MLKENEDRPPDSNHPYDCTCPDCQKKFGSLPLLIQVIEDRENPEVPESKELEFSKEDSSKDFEASRNEDESCPYEEEPTASTSSTSRPPMTCPHCSKNFTHRGDFNKHLRKHTGEKPFTCAHCPKKFANTSNLNRHLKVHSGLKPFKCDSCEKRFSRKDKLLLHQRSRSCKRRLP